MNAFLATARLILSLLPLIIDALKTFEREFGAGAGATKLSAFRATMEALFTTANEVGVTFEQAWPTIEKLVGGLVAVFNSFGTFKRA